MLNAEIKQELVSVIIPVYNGEAYLDRCLESVISQTYKNIEILLMDDGSTDKTPQKCKEWEKRDTRISVNHHENKGRGPNREMGISKARGKYLAFIDADDTVEPEFVELLYYAIIEEDADIAICDMDFVWPDQAGGIKRRRARKFPVLLDNTYIKKENDLLDWISISTSFCDKMIKKSFYMKSNVVQSDGQICEDVCGIVELLLSPGKIVQVPKVLYHYWQNSDSTVHSAGYSRSVENTLKYLGNIYNSHIFTHSDEYAFKYLAARLIGYGEISDSRQKDDSEQRLFEYYRCLFHPEDDRAGYKGIVFGSYTLRTIVREYQYFMPETYSFSSLISVMDEVSVNVKAEHPNQFRQRAIEADIQKNFKNRLTDPDVKFLFFDFLEERYGLASLPDGGMLTRSEAFEEAGFYQCRESWKEVTSCTQEYFDIWRKACDCFIEMVKPLNKTIIVVQTRLAQYFGQTGNKELFPEQEWIQQVNQQCEKMEDYFMKHVPEAILIDMRSEDFYTDINFPYGCCPWHMNVYWYHGMGRKLYQKLEVDGSDENCIRDKSHKLISEKGRLSEI